MFIYIINHFTYFVSYKNHKKLIWTKFLFGAFIIIIVETKEIALIYIIIMKIYKILSFAISVIIFASK
jgi:hypothetical protein